MTRLFAPSLLGYCAVQLLFGLLFGASLGRSARAQTAAQPLAAGAAEHAAAVARARALLDSLMESESIPGLSAAVGRGGRVLWSEGFGFADLEHRTPVTTLTRFRVGSVSKPMTAAAIGLLVDEGKLDLDAPVQAYVPSFPEKRWPITTRLVAGHIAGVRHYLGDENFSAVRFPSVLAGLEIFANDALLFEPGTDYSYSSYGWNLLSAVVEGASGEEFLAFMNERVFAPLGMNHTAAGHTDSIIAHRTRFYVLSDDGSVLNAPFVDNSYKWAGGGFLSTPEDMLRFGAAHLRARFLSGETMAELFRPQTLRDGRSTGYGIGWRIALNEAGETVVSHTGGSVGGTTVLTVNRDTGVVVAIVANRSGAPLGIGLAAVVEELFER